MPKDVSVEEAEKAVAEICKQREEELRSSGVDETDVKAAKRARIKRSGKNFYLPVRTSKEALARDQALLDAVDKNVSLQKPEEAVSKIRRQREVETAGGEVEGSSQGKEGGVKKQRRASFGLGGTVGSLEKAVLEGQHRQMCEEAQRHEAMRGTVVTLGSDGA